MLRVTLVLFRRVRGCPRRALVALVRGYRFFVSPALGASCRFEPSCSAYAIDALEAHGAAAGTYLTLRRLARCGPWCDGGHDPVPVRAVFRWPLFSDHDRAGRPAVPSASPSPTALPRP